MLMFIFRMRQWTPWREYKPNLQESSQESSLGPLELPEHTCGVWAEARGPHASKQWTASAKLLFQGGDVI